MNRNGLGSGISNMKSYGNYNTLKCGEYCGITCLCENRSGSIGCLKTNTGAGYCACLYGKLSYGNTVNSIVASEEFVTAYCEEYGYTYELLPEPEPVPEPDPEPTQLDRIEAQVAYTAMMTDTLLEV